MNDNRIKYERELLKEAYKLDVSDDVTDYFFHYGNISYIKDITEIPFILHDDLVVWKDDINGGKFQIERKKFERIFGLALKQWSIAIDSISFELLGNKELIEDNYNSLLILQSNLNKMMPNE